MQQATRLYPDFMLTAENGHEEPINRPIAIQGHGHMLVFAGSDSSLRLHAISQSLAEQLELEIDSLWGESPLRSLPDVFTEILLAGANAERSANRCSNWGAPNGKQYDVISHHNSDDCIVLELEPAIENGVDPQLLPRVARQIATAPTSSELYNFATSAIAELYDFDRVMIYQFDEDNHGHVVGEHKRNHLEPYLGLHYPETDIPKIARDVFLEVGSRFIADIHKPNDSILFSPEPLPDTPYLDLTHSQLRAISPIHLTYLENMGVQSTLTLSIVINGSLWGLMACHHYSPRQIRFDSRAQGEMISAVLAKRITELDVSEQELAESEGRSIETEFLDSISLVQDYQIVISQNAADILNLCDADGVVLVTQDETPLALGLVPERSLLLEVRDWLVKNGHDTVFETSEFSSETGINSTSECPIGGMLTSCLSNVTGNYLIWFRRPFSQTTYWAGDPKKSFSIETSPETGELTLHPRQSFAKWQVVVEGQSGRWAKSTLKTAQRIREAMLNKELIFTTTERIRRSNNDFMQLTYAAVHDLQEPLRTQSNYLELIEETLETSPVEDQKSYIEATKLATERMRELIRDLLSFSSVGTENRREKVNLNAITTELLDDLAYSIEESGAIINVGNLPTIYSDRQKLKQLILNLLTNAMKYLDEGQQPIVDIYIETDKPYWSFCIKDNGIGIEEQYFDTIFNLFHRLHRKSEYNGTGIGLATCKKIAESIGVDISVESEIGQGSTFRVKFHESILRENHDQ